MPTTDSKDPKIKLMAESVKTDKRCQWQEIYFIGYHVVRYDRVIKWDEMANIDWLDVYNTLTRAFYKVFMTQALVSPKEAIDPTRKLSDGWTYGIVYRGSDPSAVAYREIKDTGLYQVSFVKFTRWKTNMVAQALKNLFF